MLQTVFTIVLGALTSLFDSINGIVLLYIFTMFTELTTSLIILFKQKKFTKNFAIKRLWKKIGAALIILVAALIDSLFKNLSYISLPSTVFQNINMLICPLVLVWLELEELKSITKNAVAMGAKLPRFVSKLFALLNKNLSDISDSTNQNEPSSDTQNNKSTKK